MKKLINKTINATMSSKSFLITWLIILCMSCLSLYAEKFLETCASGEYCDNNNHDLNNIGSEKQQKEAAATELTVEYFKKKNSQKLPHFSRRPKAETVSIDHSHISHLFF